MKSDKTLNRRELLKHSGLIAVGFSVLPKAVLAAATAPQTSVPVSMARLGTYQIVVPDSANPTEKEASEKLQHYLKELTKKDVVIKPESQYKSGAAFFLGQTKFAAKSKIDTKQLKEDGFLFHPVARNMIVAGGSGKGTLYAVYGLLEMWGFRMYTPKAIVTPKVTTVSLPTKELVVIPVVSYRTMSYRDTRDEEYTNWHRLSSRSDWGLFVHTFNDLVSPDKYGKTHPEYFSLVNGQRLPGTQLCLSNPEVLSVLAANLKERIAARPAPNYWSVSQNDNDQYCHCDNCVALNTKYGNVPSGSILYFTNLVAKQFPDKIISTLAYWYSRTSPKDIKAEPNVNIMLCNIESRRQGPVFETDPAFSRDLVGWGQIANNILIWDYNIQFANLVSPFPNLHTLKPNIKFYNDNKVNALYMQANGQSGGEMAGLRAYMISKLMWDPAADDSVLMNDFLNGYYGAAGPFVRQYIDKMKESLISTGFKLNIFGSPEDAKDAYLSADMLKVYSGIFDQAEKAVANDPELLSRVKIARLPLQYAVIQIGRNEVPDSPRSMFAHSGDRVIVRPEMKTMVADFVTGCKADNVSRVRERTTSPEDYKASYDRIFTKMDEVQHSKALHKKINSVTVPDGGEAKAAKLTDGIFGSWESWSAPDVNWVAYKGEHVDFVLDLGEVADVRAINMDFLNAQAQPDWNLLVLPTFVTYATSTDGTTFGSEIKIANTHDPNPKVNPDIAKIPVQSFRADLGGPVKARYVKVHGESLLKMPAWHIRAGHPAELLSDQIVVEG